MIAAAGGVVLRRTNRDALRRRRRHRRVAHGRPRRARRAGHDRRRTGRCSTTTPRARCAAMCHDREPLYREVADAVVDTRPSPPTTSPTRSSRRWSAMAEHVDGHRAARRARYDVVVGHGAVAELAGLLPASARRAAVVTQAGDPVRTIDLRVARPSVFEIGDGEDAQVARPRSSSWPWLRPHRADPQRRRRRRRRRDGHRRRRVRRRDVAPRRAGRPRRHDAARHGRRRDRRQDRGQPARGQEPRRRVLAAVWRDLRPRRAATRCRHASGARGDGEMAKYHFLTGDDLDAMDLDRARRPLRRDQGRRRRRRRARGRPAGTAQLRPHAGARAGDRHATTS